MTNLCKNLKEPKWKIRAQTNWSKLRIGLNGVKVVMQKLRDNLQNAENMLVGGSLCQECDMIDERRSKRLRDEVEQINYKQTRGYSKKVEIHEKIKIKKRKLSSIIVSEIGMELCEWMTLCGKIVKQKKGIG